MGRSGYTCVRRTLCWLNLFFWIIGCGILGVGVWLHLAYGGFAKLLPTYRVLSADSLCMAAGVLIFLVGFLGCCGSWFETKCLLVVYFIIVVLVFLLEFTAGTLGFAYRKHIRETLQEELKVGIKDKYTINNDAGLKNTWDQIQLKFDCCGVKEYTDWHKIAAWPEKEWVPQSCCLAEFRKNSTCGKTRDIYMWHQQGCYMKIHMWLMERLYIMGIICMAFAFIQLFGLISAMLLICTVEDKRKSR
ncbi:tetraspanin-9-like isoform X2 [Limulus polyphemus]|uniref:Tetraspanin n=1 Tax=Limulus polyphemus TaxID=6850 RepID=A0ABM1C0I4_LIMPO|nr:tetraspanin-9-like isoform X2 [Limulus polyphemus]